MTKPGYDRLEREAVERLDVLEDEIPRGICSVRGCDRSAPYEWAGEWRTHFLCPRHRALYRVHDRILRRIRSL